MRSRLLSIAATAALAIGLVAAPASAVGTTRWVDKDGAAGPNGCGGSATAAATIADALSAAGAGDTIVVCPGVYRETVSILTKGITLRAAQPYKARLAPRSPAGGAIVTIGAKNVTVQWLTITAPTTGACTKAGSGILVDGVANAQIISNRIIANPDGDTYSTPCGLSEGITVDDGSTAAVVNHNIVRAFQLVGIIVHNADAKVSNNSVQYWHASVCAASSTACRKLPGRATPAVPQVTTGIRVYQSTGSVDLNGITNAPDGQTPQVRLQHGISTMGVDGVRIRKNDIRLADYGIWLESSNNLRVIGNVVVGPVQPASRAARKVQSPASYAQSGILGWSGSGSRFADNHVLRNISGLDLTSLTTGATVTGNDLTGNTWDCLDHASNPANTWTDNLGNADSPNGLCTDAPIQSVPGSPT